MQPLTYRSQGVLIRFRDGGRVQLGPCRDQIKLECQREMPIFEYSCHKCQCDFEALVLPGETEDPQCPRCCGREVTKRISAGAVRPHGIPKGSGGFKGPECAPRGR